MASLTCIGRDGSFVHVTDVRINEYPQYVPGKYSKMFDSRVGVYLRCSMKAKSGNGKPCRYYAHGRLNGSLVCSGHFPPLATYKDFKRLKDERLRTEVVHLKECEEVECPVCMEEFVAVHSSLCGHKVCSSCCRHMKESGRTMTCPMCRDVRFKSFAELTCV
jgi:hypothetical protein